MIRGAPTCEEQPLLEGEGAQYAKQLGLSILEAVAFVHDQQLPGVLQGPQQYKGSKGQREHFHLNLTLTDNLNLDENTM
jgi:hypothetical protein